MNALTPIIRETPAASSLVVGRFVVDSRWHGDLSEIDVERVLGYSIIRHSNIKTHEQLDAAEAHNSRDIETPNARKDAPQPVELLTWREGSFRERAEWVRGYHNAPERPQKHGNLAWEDVLTASPEYWNRDGDWKQQPVEKILADPLITLAFKYAQKKFHQLLISVKVHLDEETPHVHIIALALVYGSHMPRGAKPADCLVGSDGKKLDYRRPEWKWTYYGSKVRGSRWQLARNHDEWASFCKDLGLIRGSDGGKMEAGERRERNKGYTGRASTIVANAKKTANAEIEEAHRKAAAVREDASAAARAAEEKLVDAKQAAEKLLANAEIEAKALQARVRKEAEESAKALTDKAGQSATEVILHALSKAKELTDKATGEAAMIVADAAANAEALRIAACSEERNILATARTQAGEIADKIRREASEQAEKEAKVIREAAEFDAARIRQEAEAERQRQMNWFAAENARLDHEKAETKKAKAAADAAVAAAAGRSAALQNGEAELARRMAQVGDREKECSRIEADLKIKMDQFEIHRAGLHDELSGAHRLAKAMQEHYREFIELPSNVGKVLPPKVAKAASWMKSEDAKELKEALRRKREYEAYRDQMGR